jgi:hypothetical protein
MNRSFKNIAFFFFMGFGAFYLTADFLINQGQSSSETLNLIYNTFDMPFFFSAGMYALASIFQQVQKKYNMGILGPVFWALAVAWTVLLVYLNLGYESFL